MSIEKKILREFLSPVASNTVVESIDTTAYVYKWTNLDTGKWYIGSRTAKGSHPDDGYFCSSVEVKLMIQSSPSEWKREILATGDPIEMRNLESKLLTQLDAKNDPMSFNRHNSDGKFNTIGRIESDAAKQKRIAKLKGRKKPEGFGDKVSAIHKGKIVSDETKRKIGIASKGRKQGPEARRKNSEKNSGVNNAGFKGYYISPTGEVFDSSIKAAEKYNVTRHTIVNRAINNKKGWKFQPKESV